MNDTHGSGILVNRSIVLSFPRRLSQQTLKQELRNYYVKNLRDHRLEFQLKDYNSGERRTCILGGFWSDTHVFEGDIVHILANFDEGGVCNITDKEGLIIVNPDLLLSGTTVVSSVFCMRKLGIDKGNVQMLYGSIIHQVFQQVLRKQIFEEDKILKEAEETVKQLKFLHDMYGSNVIESEVLEEIKKYIPPLQKWLQQYTTIGKNILGAQRKADSDIAILKVKDIEENIWSPRYGVKGKIDLTVEVKIRKKNIIEHKTVPLELKTGRATFSMEHKGQVTLYSMMSSDRREDPGQGLLLYLKEPDMKVISADHLNKRGLLQLRNEMAYYLSRQVLKSCEMGSNSYTLGRLPEPINNPRACSKCPQLLNCSLYQKAIEQRDHSPSHTMATLVPQTLAHLTQDHLDYFTHWCLLLDLEMKSGLKHGGLKDIWCKSGKEREDLGEAISGLTLDNSQLIEEDSEQIFIKFHRERSLSSCGLGKHDYVIVSSENTSHIAVCMGTITEITDTDIVLLTERETLPRLRELSNAVYRIDKYDGYNTSSILYCNLSNILQDQPNCCRLRELIIGKRKPEFVNKMSKGEIEKVKSVFKPLNKPQKTAILKVLMAKDYVLIKGYPGTGKTSTIVSLVRVLETLGKSVLLTSYTHSAVDNILLKLKKVGVSFLRLGKVSKVHADIQPYTAERQAQGLTSVGELREFYNSQKIVATSSLGINHPLFTHRRFDVCIIDEASQILQPASIGPLFSADKFVLVGDPKQLPPVIQSKEARDLGMDESLFVRLDTGSATFELNLQYRMNKDIMYLSNTLVYNGALRCGSDEVANHRLIFPDPQCVAKVLDEEPWLAPVLGVEPYKAAVFINTEHIQAHEERDRAGLIKNVTESRLVCSITQSCVKCGIEQSDIGVIAPYRHQVALIKNDLRNFQDVEVNTVDQYQGRDKDVIIISFTRSFSNSNEAESKSGQLLKDVRRLNVAITRAKKKLIMIGDICTLQQYGPLKQIIDMMGDMQAVSFYKVVVLE
ncbi:hypothetical protein FSP39_008260 [Pinctada imbricata]|uniref:DNA replication ATP-dependent helicase/nuclease n=1 Tax=Pinctada imbricata TaxID=66713 RepID=A0AA88XN09_PINIB|nr:hypothetical protein FSP39_008260 [Pinctada imbricata]